MKKVCLQNSLGALLSSFLFTCYTIPINISQVLRDDEKYFLNMSHCFPKAVKRFGPLVERTGKVHLILCHNNTQIYSSANIPVYVTVLGTQWVLSKNLLNESHVTEGLDPFCVILRKYNQHNGYKVYGCISKNHHQFIQR